MTVRRFFLAVLAVAALWAWGPAEQSALDADTTQEAQ